MTAVNDSLQNHFSLNSHPLVFLFPLHDDKLELGEHLDRDLVLNAPVVFGTVLGLM